MRSVLVRRAAAFAFLIQAGCGRIGFSEHDDALPTPDPPLRQRLDVDLPDGFGSLSDFPILVTLDPTRIDYSRAHPLGDDLWFGDEDGTPFAHEVEAWDPEGSSYIWVKLPALDPTSVLWMYYGDESAAPGQDPAAVWTAAYAGVWHLDQDPFGEAPQVLDSSFPANHGTALGSMTAANRVSGRMGDGLQFDGADDRIDLGDRMVDGVAELTLSAWIEPGTIDTGDPAHGTPGGDAILSKSGGGGDDNLAFLIGRGSAGRGDLYGYVDSGQNVEVDTTDRPIAAGSWSHVAVVYAAGRITLYSNGEPAIASSGAAAGALVDNPMSLHLGSKTNGQFYDGLVDEVRIATVARSDAWIAAQYLSMTDSLLIYGPPEPF